MREVMEERFPAAEGGCLGSESFGRLINKAQFERLRGMLKRTKGTVAIGGDMDEQRLKMALTVVADADGTDAVMEEYVAKAFLLSQLGFVLNAVFPYFPVLLQRAIRTYLTHRACRRSPGCT